MRSIGKTLLVGLLGLALVATAIAEPPKDRAQYSQEKVRLFERARDVDALRDPQRIVRQLRHFDRPFTADEANLVAPTPKSLADAYVRAVAGAISLDKAWIGEIGPFEKSALADEGNQVKFFEQKRLGGATTVSYVQTLSGLRVWQGGMAVTVLNAPLRVVSSTNSFHGAFDVKMPDDAAFPLQGIDAARLAKALQLEDRYRETPPRINGTELLVYQYDSANRVDPESRRDERARGLEAGPPTLPLPNVPDAVRPGEHRVVAEVLFTLPVAGADVNWRAFVDVQTGAVLYLRAFVAHANGLVFVRDPTTQTGNVPPTAPITDLDACRSDVTLSGLDPPAGTPPEQHLTGEFVEIVDRSAPNDAGPTEDAPYQFAYSADTNDFAAVNAYHHSDALFRMVQGMGIDVYAYFDETDLPVPVDHRATIGWSCPNGNCVNAQAPGNTTGTGSDGFRYALAATGTNVGIAAAWRVVLHEFGHALLWDSVHWPNFGFAHSAGDSLAVILNDPGSQAPDRFDSFPWVGIGRRHDRSVAAGWGWGGSQDTGGYSSEQVLSTTLFRAYRSIGGDAAEVATRQLAADYSANLIVRGIGLLATDPVTPSPSPDIFEASLMTADISTASIEGHPGGAVHKLIRWAFEKQGLHRAPGTPSTEEGDPPPVDVYIDDSRGGEYTYLESFWHTTDYWNRQTADGGTTHETPILGVPNFLYVKVQNRGTQEAHNVTVRTYHNRPGMGLLWPGSWKPTTTSVLPGPGDPSITIPSGGSAVVGPFEWQPAIANHECILASVTADDDLSNIDPASVLPCNSGPTPHWRLVPFDNNIVQRNVAPVPASNAQVLIRAFEKRQFFLHNPYRKEALAQVQLRLPRALKARDWKLELQGDMPRRFKLPELGHRKMGLRLVPGQDFRPADLKESAIEVRGYIDGMLVGGMTFPLDPRMRDGSKPAAGDKGGTQ
ncbi:MAG TPA: hypothetical protein VMY37_22605 [Thermoguttaceae bacterium]|nr:hypothetical protein [Thermoguttaceae bacterium]